MQFIFHEKQDSKEERKILDPYIDRCKQIINTNDYTSSEASLCLPSDKHILSQVEEMVNKKKTPELKYSIVIGIGGSNLGTKAIYDALYGDVDLFTPGRYPKMIFLDTNDPEFLHSFSRFAKKHITHENEFVISIISKSGGTTEIIVNAEMALAELKQRFVNWKQRCIIISDEGSPLWNEAKRMDIDTLGIPKNVGGRYSVLSAVGLFPLAIIGADITSLLKGAEEMRERCSKKVPENPALQSSIFQFLQWKEEKTIHNSFFFHRELESLGKWYRQLTGESLGKDKKGITPLVSIGSVDHHSMVQLYWGGPEDKTTEFIYTKKSISYSIPKEILFLSLNKVAGKTTHEIMSAITKGTCITYTNLKLPFFEVILEEINCYELGCYLQYKMLETLYLAKLLGVNAFDQPQVELYKIETKKILEK